MRSWNNLTSREREQVGLMLASLKEFSYGLDRANTVATGVPAGAAMSRFYSTALYQYFANYFLVTGAHKLRDVVRNLGSADLLEPIETLLATPLGETTLGEIARNFRDKFLTHQSFTFGPLEDRVHAKFDILAPENAERFSSLIRRLFSEMQIFYVRLAERFPEAFLMEDAAEDETPGSRITP